MAKQKKLQQYVFKINSTLLRKNNWDLTLPLNRARNTTGLVVALADSQILSWINELNGTEDYDIQAKEIKRQIKEIKKEPASRSNKTKISNLYQQLYRLQFKEDYLCVIMDKKSDYDRANQGFYVLRIDNEDVNYDYNYAIFKIRETCQKQSEKYKIGFIDETLKW